MRSEKEIYNARQKILDNKNLTHGYREDAIAILDWVTGGENFDGLLGD